ncbi:MAG: type II toxin-antitoxin system PrlF family antitoxin [Alphaproteobacteria bacterium]|nr:type II toxin-antitoxin system PrlF family antitoxin [Alphaproteobacteria bacterium]
MSQSTVTAKGQTTIPQEIRRHMKLRPGDRVIFVKEPNGSVRMVAKNVQIEALAGMLKSDRTATVEEMNEATAEEAGEQFRRSVRGKSAK